MFPKKFFVCFVVMFIGIFHSANVMSQPVLTYKGSMAYNHGIFKDSWVSGHYLYTVTERELMIYDINTPQNPQIVGTLETPGKAQAVRVVGNYAYILDEGTGLLVVNVSSTSNPFVTDTLDLGSYPLPFDCPDRMQVSGNYLYVSRYYGIKVFSIFNPAFPVARDSIYFTYLNSNVCDFAVSGNYLYMSTSADSGLMILNISNPDSIFKVKCFPGFGSTEGIEVKDTLAYLGSLYPDRGLKIINIKDPNNPSVVSFFNAGIYYAFYDVKVIDTLAYCYKHGGALNIINVVNPATPDSVSQPIQLGGGEGTIDIFGNIMLMTASHTTATGDEYETAIINMTDKLNPSMYSSITTDKGPLMALTCYGNKLMVSNLGELLVHNLTNPLNPTYVNKYSDAASSYNIAMSDKYMYYVNGWKYGLHAINLKDYSLNATVTKQGNNYFQDITRSDKGYILGKRDSLFIYDDTLGIVGTFPDTGTTQHIYVKGDSVYTFNQTTQDFKVIDISTPTNPVLVGSYPGYYLTSDFVVVDSLAYFCESNYLKSYRMDNSLGMVCVDSIDVGGYYRIEAQANYLYITNYDDIIILHISPDNSMTEVARYNTTGKPYGMSFYGPYIYLGDTYSVGIYEFPISLAPKIISKTDTIQAEDSTFSYNIFARACPLPSYSLITHPAGLTLDSTTGEIEWTPTNANVGDTIIRILATNSVSSDTQTYHLHILNSAPHFTSIPDTTIYRDSLYTYDANSDDEGHGNTFYTGLTLPGWLTIDSLTGVLSGTAPDSVQNTIISLKVDDGNAKADTQNFTLHIVVGVEEKIDSIPTVFKISSIKPNPFGKMVNIQYALPKESKVNLSIYNLCGQNVATLVNETKKIGYHTVCWKPSGQFASNIYFIKFNAGSYRETKKIILTK
ncbi:MAG: putative Ig domain-containing protein [bacterium]|nr:putative Ig domain-containing protein [bacterium]